MYMKDPTKLKPKPPTHLVLFLNHCVHKNFAWHALARGSGGMAPRNFENLRLNLEAVLMENYETLKLMVGS